MSTTPMPSVQILPFLGGIVKDSGFEKYKHVIHEGVHQDCSPTCDIGKNIMRYITGLNEEGPEVLDLPKDQQKEKILEIRRIIAEAENKLAGNHKVSPERVDIPKDEFYNNVEVFKSVLPIRKDPDTGGVIPYYWDNLAVKLENAGHALNLKNIEDKLRKYIAEAGGYAMVAPSLEKAKSIGGYMFYLDKLEDTAAQDASIYVQKNNAGTLLNTMREKDSNRLFYVTKMVSRHPLQWRSGRNSTPLDALYIECQKFIDGEGKEKGKLAAVQQFTTWAKMNMDDLKIHCFINDGFALGLLQTLTDGTVQYVPSQTKMGKGKDNAFAFLKSGGESEPVYVALSKAIEKEWKDD